MAVDLASAPTTCFMVVASYSSFQAQASLDSRGHSHFPSTMGGLAISYADVASYEVKIGGQTTRLVF